jgi:hypothetical protein
MFLKSPNSSRRAADRTAFLIVPFIRCVRLTEALFDLAQAERGEPWDAGYTLHNLLALENLSPVDGLPV